MHDASQPQEAPQPQANLQPNPAQDGGLAESSFVPAVDRSRLQLLAGIVKDIDHTVLKQSTTREDLDRLCSEALLAQQLLGVGPASVCVNSADVAYCAAQLAGSGIAVCSVVGFPLGKMLSDAKVAETRAALGAGAAEIDMVINVGALKSGQSDYVRDEIRHITEACHERGALLKVIIETCNLSESEKVTACNLAVEAGADYVKTSTGFESGGATPEDVELMSRTVGAAAQVKASGGMKTPEDALEMRSQGAARFGASGLLKVILAEVMN